MTTSELTVPAAAAAYRVGDNNAVLSLGPSGINSGLVIDGTARNDTLNGGSLDDTIRGWEGADIISGFGGDDRLYGGAGDDLLDGGDGNDLLSDNQGHNILLGGAGNDRLDASGAAYAGDASKLDGGAGDDTLIGGTGDDTLLGGDGNDELEIVDGGRATTVTVDAGNGDDTIDVLGMLSGQAITATGGAGIDTYRFANWTTSPLLTITDFMPGPNGDVLDVATLLRASPILERNNPFGPVQFLRLQQSGVDTLLRVDLDGAAGPGGFKTVAVLKGVIPSQLTAENTHGIAPEGSAKGITVEGTGKNDVLQGGTLDDVLSGHAGNDTLNGGAGNDVLDGGDGNDVLVGAQGNNVLIGGAGIDSAYYVGWRQAYLIEQSGDGDALIVTTTGAGTSDTVAGIERIIFADQALALDTDGTAGFAYRLYRAAFDRPADLAGLGYWIKMMDQGAGVLEVAAGFVASDEFKQLYGAGASNTDTVDHLYRNVLHRAPDQAGLDYWVEVLDDHKADLPAVLAMFSEAAENKAAVAELIGHGITYVPYAG